MVRVLGSGLYISIESKSVLSPPENTVLILKLNELMSLPAPLWIESIILSWMERVTNDALYDSVVN
jgi:hypothetical protein